MFSNALHSRISYLGSKILPLNESSYIAYNQFRSTFGDDGSVLVIGISDPGIFDYHRFNAWYRLGDSIGKLKGVSYVLSTAHLYTIKKDTLRHRFAEGLLNKNTLASQQEADSIRSSVFRLPFYEGFLFNQGNPATLMAVSIDQKVLNSSNRTPLVHEIMRLGKAFGMRERTDVHFSGLPFIRSVLT